MNTFYVIINFATTSEMHKVKYITYQEALNQAQSLATQNHLQEFTIMQAKSLVHNEGIVVEDYI